MSPIDAYFKTYPDAKAFSKDDYDNVYRSMMKYVRMPHTNTWRFYMEKNNKLLHRDCPQCTLDGDSGKNSMLLADYLNQKMGKQIIGSDIVWNTLYAEFFFPKV